MRTATNVKLLLAIGIASGALLGVVLVLLLNKNLQTPSAPTTEASTAESSAENRIRMPDMDEPSEGLTTRRLPIPPLLGQEASSDVRIRVLDASTLAPIPESVVVRGPVGARVVATMARNIVAESDVDGVISTSRDKFREREEHWVFGRDHRPVPLDLTSLDDGAEDIYLPRGHALALECRDIYGNQLKDCQVFASRTQLPTRAELLLYGNTGIATGPGRGGVYWSTSDDAGFAVMEGLEPGDYQIVAVRDGHSAVALSPGEVISVVGDTNGSITLAPILAAAVRIQGDDTITYQISHRGHSRTSRQWADLARDKATLQRRFPEAIVVAYVVTHDPKSSGPAKARVLTRASGMVEFEVPLRPVGEIEREFEYPALGDGSAGACVETKVTIRDLQGVRIEERIFYLRCSGLLIPLAEGSQFIPPGQWEIACTDSRLAGLFDPRRVTVPGPIEIQLRTALVPCRLAVTDAEGRPYGEFTLSVTSAGRTTNHFVRAGAETTLMLPPGPATFATKVWGFEDTVTEFTVGGEASPDPFPVVLRD